MLGHDYLGHNGVCHKYIQAMPTKCHSYTGHTHLGHSYMCDVCIGHNYLGHNYLGHNYILVVHGRRHTTYAELHIATGPPSNIRCNLRWNVRWNLRWTSRGIQHPPLPGVRCRQRPPNGNRFGPRPQHMSKHTSEHTSKRTSARRSKRMSTSMSNHTPNHTLRRLDGMHFIGPSRHRRRHVHCVGMGVPVLKQANTATSQHHLSRPAPLKQANTTTSQHY